MSSPSKSPPALAPLATALSSAPQASVQDPEPALTGADQKFLSGLDPYVTGDEHVRSDMLALLTDDETVEALTRYAPVLAAVGLHVAPAVSAAPQLKRLQRLRRRLDLAQNLVTRHLQTTGAPTMDTVSALHRFVAATPEGSPVRVAFSLFLERWESTFRAPGRPTKTREPRTDQSPDTSDKTTAPK